MKRNVFCIKLKKELPGLSNPPFPGPRGEKIFNEVSAEAWSDWQRYQTMLINEKHLNMRDFEARELIQKEMEKFFSDDDYKEVEGYTPKEKS